MAAETDDVVPPGHARRLFELAAPPKDFYVIPDATHNDTYLAGGRQYVQKWREWQATEEKERGPAGVPRKACSGARSSRGRSVAREGNRQWTAASGVANRGRGHSSED